MPGLTLAIAKTMPGTGCLVNQSLKQLEKIQRNYLRWSLFQENQYNII